MLESKSFWGGYNDFPKYIRPALLGVARAADKTITTQDRVGAVGYVSNSRLMVIYKKYISKTYNLISPRR